MSLVDILKRSLELYELQHQLDTLCDPLPPDEPIPYVLTEKGRRVAEAYATETTELIK
jgi:hypothetical protein